MLHCFELDCFAFKISFYYSFLTIVFFTRLYRVHSTAFCTGTVSARICGAEHQRLSDNARSNPWHFPQQGDPRNYYHFLYPSPIHPPLTLPPPPSPHREGGFYGLSCDHVNPTSKIFIRWHFHLPDRFSTLIYFCYFPAGRDLTVRTGLHRPGLE